MKLGQTSAVNFASSFLASILGFASTLYIARVLGAGPLGVYQVAVGLVSWLAIVGRVGISRAISKRVSEGRDQSEYATAAAGIILGLFAVVTVGVLLFRGHVANYVGHPGAAVFVVLMLLVVLANSLVDNLLVGLQLVHVSGMLSPVRIGGRALTQILLIVAGLGTVALFVGYITGIGIVAILGLYFVVRDLPAFRLPERQHFKRLFDFAKFSWLGGLQSRMFSYTDVLVLRLFVSSGLIGVYTAAWNVAQFLLIFSGALRSTLFPEMSEISAQEDPQAVSRIVEQSLTFGGLFLIPGVFGGALLGERILRIYGPEFPRGSLILLILVIANLFMGYQNQLLNALNAVDRPDLAFRVNAVFVVANVALNATLIYFHGWVGAAVATAVSVLVSLVLAYRHVAALIDFAVPVGEIARQWLAAGVMAVVVYAGLWVENTHRVVGHNFVVVVGLVVVGAGVYFLSLLGLSTEFRETVARNVPFDVPFASA